MHNLIQRLQDRAADFSRRSFGWTLLVGLLLLSTGCISTPVTGRRAFNFFSLEQDKQLGEEAYVEIRNDPRVVRSGQNKEMVERVMQRIVAVSHDPGFIWEVVLIDDPQTINAFALPGGKMAVYTGILQVAQSETGLAVVMGHEIAHAIARHGTERVSRSNAPQVILQALSQATGGDGKAIADLAGTVLNLAVGLPHGRNQESEADEIGLKYMALAGYDPREASRFWQRMSEMTGGSGNAPPEFLSTHPSHETRINHLESLLPEALVDYERARGSSPEPRKLDPKKRPKLIR